VRWAAGEAGDAIGVRQRPQEGLSENPLQLSSIQGAGVLHCLLVRMQRRVQIAVHLCRTSGPLSAGRQNMRQTCAGKIHSASAAVKHCITCTM
jgi:hypothetical protein